MYLSRELTDSSLPKIGKQFGGRDHTTVIHATSKIARLIREDRSVYNLVQELTARVRQVRYPDDPLPSVRLSPVRPPTQDGGVTPDPWLIPPFTRAIHH